MFSRPKVGAASSLALVAVAFTLAACNADHTAGRSAGTLPSSMSVHVSDAGFVGVPDRLRPGLVDLSFDNDGTATHMAAIAQLSGDRDAGDLAAFMATPAARRGMPAWMRLVGGVDEIDPGHRGGWAGRLDPGSYLLLSMTSDTQGRPELMDGFIAPFDVADGRPGTAGARHATATIALGSGGTLTMSSLPAGTALIDVVNQDGTARTVDVTRIKPGRTFAQVMAEAQHGNGVPSSLIRLGGTGVAAHDQAQIGIEPAHPGDQYVVFDIDHVQQGAIAHLTVG